VETSAAHRALGASAFGVYPHGQKTPRAPCPTHEPQSKRKLDKSGSEDPLLGPDCTHPYIYVRERSRTHLSLDKDAPIPRRVQPPELGKVVELPEVGDSITDMNAGQPSLPGSALSYTETLRRTPLCGAAIELLAPVSNNIAHTNVYLNSSLPPCSRFLRLIGNYW
jgi:hypothetical protein